MFSLVFARHLKIVLIGKAEGKCLLHPVNFPLNVLLAFLRPNGMRVYSYKPDGVVMAVLQMSSGCIGIS
jgi:hypothetical protein